jgi:type IV pilus assembly protein PilC
MAVWLYTAMTQGGKEVEGQLEAPNKDEATSLIRKKRLRLTKLKKKPAELKLNIGSGIKSTDIARFTRQFSAMNGAGLPLLQCLQILSEQSDNPAMADVVKKVGQKIQGGGTLAEALAMHPKVFSRLYVNMVSAGEAGGILDTILMRLAEYAESSERLKRKIKGAMMYPTIVMIVAVSVVAVLMILVVPKFAEIFESGGQELPMPTKVVMMVSSQLQNNFMIIMLVIVGAIITLVQVNKTPKGKYFLDATKMKLPGIGPVEIKGSVARFTRTLGTLLQSGVSIIDALQVTASTAGNSVLEKGILKVVESISGGNTIMEPLKETGIFPPMVVQMIGVGEKTGDLPDMLIRIADFYDEEVDAAVEAMTSMIEPLIIVFLGVVIGFILVAMYMPMFSMSDNVS